MKRAKDTREIIKQQAREIVDGRQKLGYMIAELLEEVEASGTVGEPIVTVTGIAADYLQKIETAARRIEELTNRAPIAEYRIYSEPEKLPVAR